MRERRAGVAPANRTAQGMEGYRLHCDPLSETTLTAAVAEGNAQVISREKIQP